MQFKDNTLSGILRSLAADEFLAWASYYFYEIISQGNALNFTNKIFNENGKDELEDHYHKLVNWMQSNHIPVPTGLVEMQEICNTPYENYSDPAGSSLLVDQMITAEKEAIDAYVRAMKEPAVLEYPDLVIILGEICNDEREHLKNLEDVKSNIDKETNRTMSQHVFNFSERIIKVFGKLNSWVVTGSMGSQEVFDNCTREEAEQYFKDRCPDEEIVSIDSQY